MNWRHPYAQVIGVCVSYTQRHCHVRIEKGSVQTVAIQLDSLEYQIKSLLLSHHHSTSALVSEILTSVLQTVQKKTQSKTQQFTYGQYIFTDCTEDNVQNTHTYTQYTQCTIKTYLFTNSHYTPYVHVCIMYTSMHSNMWRCNRLFICSVVDVHCMVSSDSR